MSMTVHAPYRFNPVNEWIWTPDWGDQVSHDIPFKDGISGEIELEITAESPLLIGANRTAGADGIGEVKPFRLPNGKYAIPSSALQGPIRALLETASFSRMGPFVDNKRFGVRDLTDAASAYYLDRVVGKTRSGWLRRIDDGQLELLPCRYSKIAFPELSARTRVSNEPPKPRSRRDKKKYKALKSLKKKSNAADRYKWFSNANLLKGAFSIDKGEERTGHIVLTGNPSDNTSESTYGKKNIEFLFHDENWDKREKLSSSGAFEAFVDIHAPNDGRPESPAWRYYNDTGYPLALKFGDDKDAVQRPFRSGGWMPVFYIEENGEITSFGLASMFKLAYSLTTHDLLRNSSEHHLRRANQEEPVAEKMDFASLIFGCVANDKGEAGLKRRASFDLSIVQEDTRARDSVETVLMGPKPSFYPAYVQQEKGANAAADQLRSVNGRLSSYATYDAKGGSSKPKLAGRKIWPATTSAAAQNNAYSLTLPPRIDSNLSKRVRTKLHPLPTGTTFTTKLRFHNLRPVELGGLIWSLTFGETDPLIGKETKKRHRIGGGKPLGFGHVAIVFQGGRLVHNDPEKDDLEFDVKDKDLKPVQDTLSGYVKSFVSEIDQAASADEQQHVFGQDKTWSDSDQIKSILYAATPGKNKNLNFKYMSLDDHSAAKRQGRFMAPYIDEIDALHRQ